MDFATAILVLVAYLLRLHQLIPGGEWFFAQKYLMAASIAAMVFRGRGFVWRDLVKTPLDWAMVIYCGFIVFHEVEHWETFKEVIKLFLFFAVTVQALCNSRRLFLYMCIWAGCIMVLALVTLDSAFGLDFTDSQSLLPLYEQRQCLNLSIYNNPNALGHTLALGFPMFYYAFFSRRRAGLRLLSVVFWGAVAAAIYLTESKGAFLVGGGLLCLVFWVGRPWIARVLMIILIASVGVGAFLSLPRMESIQSSSAVARDEGIWGRLAVWNVAMENLQSDGSGVGWKNFNPYISYVDPLGKVIVFQKGPHNSYVAVVAELGYIGLFLYLLVLAVCLRIVVQLGPLNEDQERAKMLLVMVLLGYAVSGWLIERPYHVEYFFIAGACAAFQRLRLLGEELRQDENVWKVEFEPAAEEETAPSPLLLHARPGPLLVLGHERTSQLADSLSVGSAWLQPLIVGSPPLIPNLAPERVSSERSTMHSEEEPPAALGDLFKPLLWRRIGLVELILSLLGLYGVLELCKWALNRFFF
jgi:O-antigen ligase